MTMTLLTSGFKTEIVFACSQSQVKTNGNGTTTAAESNGKVAEEIAKESVDSNGELENGVVSDCMTLMDVWTTFGLTECHSFFQNSSEASQADNGDNNISSNTDLNVSAKRPLESEEAAIARYKNILICSLGRVPSSICLLFFSESVPQEEPAQKKLKADAEAPPPVAV